MAQEHLPPVVQELASKYPEVWEAYGRQDDVDTSAMVLTMDDGVPVVVTGARHDPAGYDFRAELFGSSDSIVVGVDERTPVHSVQPDAPPMPDDPYRGFLDRFHQAFIDETAAFVDLALGRGINHCPPEEALSALRVAGACQRSWRERRVVDVAEGAGVD